MANTTSLSLKLVYRGGQADKGRLDLYDGSDSLFGFAKALNITAHAFVNRDIVGRATATKGAELYLHPPRSGSFIEVIQAVVTTPEYMAGVGTGVISNAFYDFFKFALGRAAGVAFSPKTPSVKQQLQRDEPFFDELADVLEGPLKEGHRTIETSGGTITLERPRSPLVIFDQETLEWVTTRDEGDRMERHTGNITRFNVISKNGRLYDRELKRTIPFKPHETLDDMSIRLLSRSLDETNNRMPGILEFNVRPVVSARGITKRYILMKCRLPGTLPKLTSSDRV